MNYRSELRPLLHAAENAGMDREERRALLDGTLFDAAEAGVLHMLRTSLREPKKRKRMLDMLALRENRPVAHTQIIRIFDRYADIKKEAREHLTEADIRFLNFALRYFEDWFYEASWAKPSPQYAHEEQAYLQYSVPAAFINLLAKFKEDPTLGALLYSGDRARIHSLIQQTLTSLPTLPQDTEQRVLDSETAVRYAFEQTRNRASDLYFIKTCLVAAELLRRKNSDISAAVAAIPETTDPSRYLYFDFSNGKEPQFQTMHYPPSRLPFCVVVAAHLLNTKK